MSLFFNTAGPIIPGDHYHVDLLNRLDWEEIQLLIEQKKGPLSSCIADSCRNRCHIGIQILRTPFWKTAVTPSKLRIATVTNNQTCGDRRPLQVSILHRVTIRSFEGVTAV